MKHIVYLHGLASSSLSSTPRQLQKYYPDFEVVPLELYHQCHRSLDIINTYLRSHKVDAVIGTSLGGFFALACDFDGIKIAVNPALHPDRDVPNDLAEYREVPLQLTQGSYIIQSSHDEVLGDYTAEARSLLSALHEPEMVDCFHTVTDEIGHRLTPRFFQSQTFYNLLSAAFGEPIYPLVNGKPHPESYSPF